MEALARDLEYSKMEGCKISWKQRQLQEHSFWVDSLNANDSTRNLAFN